MGIGKVVFLVSPTLYALGDKQKGTTGNKIDCASQHFKNGFVSNAGLAATVGATALIGAPFYKKAAGATANFSTVKSALKTIADYVKAAPKPVKIAAGALVALNLIVRSYKAGKIEQKYIDRAQFVDNTFKPDSDKKVK
jgi:hypothetical protein